MDSFLGILAEVGCVQHFKRVPYQAQGLKRAARPATLVYLKYSGQSALFSTIRGYSKQRRKFILPLRSIRGPSLKKTGVIYILSTSQGLHTAESCRRLQIGGILLCGIFV